MPSIITLGSGSIKQYGHAHVLPPVAASGSFTFTTFTFSSPINAGTYQSGINASRAELLGPTSAQLQTYYNSNNATLASMLSAGTYFTVPYNGYQRFVIPSTGNYIINAQGGCGGQAIVAGARGVNITATFALTQGDVIWMAIGHSGTTTHTDNADWCSAGGGGATFVAKGSALASSVCLLCAAGGQGAWEPLRNSSSPVASSSANGTSGAGFTSFKNQTINGGYGGYAGYYGYGGFGGGGASDDGSGPCGGYDALQTTSANSWVDASGTTVTRINAGDNRLTLPGYVTITAP